MLTTTNAILSVNANATSSTTISTNGELRELVKAVQHAPMPNPTSIASVKEMVDDPRTFSDFTSKAKALKKLVQRNLNVLWLQLPSGLSDALKTRCILSGSSISSLYHDEVVKDFDLWLADFGPKNTDLLHMDELIRKTYDDYIAEYSEEYSGMKKTHKVVTQNAITLINKMQFITLAKYENARIGFDFVHCMPFYDLRTDKFYISEQQMDAIVKKKLIQNPTGKAPVQWRIDKFLKRGWTF